MYDSTMRVFALLELLQGRDQVSGAELARQLAVDLRTVQRYVVRLKDLHIPVESSPGVGGAYRLRPGFRLPPLMLTNEEAFALSLGLRALAQVGLDAFAPATEGAVAKLRRVLPASLRESLRTVDEVVAIDPGPWVAPTTVTSLFTAATAIRTGRRLRFQYLTHSGATSDRHLEPFGLVHMDGRWYLLGHCLARDALRTFRLDRAASLTLTDEPFTPPASFNARAYLAEHMPFVSATFQIDCSLDMPFADAQQSFMLWRVTLSPEGDGTRLRCSRDRLDEFAAMLLSHGRRIVVHSPPELRETFARLASVALQASSPAPAAS